MKPITYCVYREDEFFVAQCLNVDVSSFGSSREEAITNLKEAVELFGSSTVSVGMETADFEAPAARHVYRFVG